MHFKFTKKSKGFTLLEILLVVGIISLLAGIVIIAINPGKQLATVRNTERKSDIKQLNSAINQYYISIGRYPASIQDVTTLTEVCNTGTLSTTTDSSVDCTGLVDLTALVPTYITAIPVDPQGPLTLNPFIKTANAATNGTGYYVMKNTTNKIVVVSQRAELGSLIAIGTSTNPFGGTTPPEEPETCTSFTYTAWTPDPCENGTQTRSVDIASPDGCEGGTRILTQSCDIPLVSYTLTYNANGGSGAPTAETREEQSTSALSATEPARSGYTFSSWNTESDGTGDTYTSSASFTMPSSDTTLWAVWEEEVNLAYGLINHWKMNDNAANQTITDSNGIKNGTYNANTNNYGSNPGKINQSIWFNGGASRNIDFGTSNWLAGKTSLTFAMWLKPDSLPAVQGIFNQYGTGVNQRNFYMEGYSNGEISLTIFGLTSTYNNLISRSAPVGSLSIGNWSHIVFTWDGLTDTINVYVNGEIKTGTASTSGTPPDAIVNTSTAIIKFGLRVSGGGGLDGYADDFRIYDRVLNGSEVQALYNNNNGTEGY